MSQGRFSRRNILIALAVTAILVIALALVAVAQGPDERDAVALPPDKITTVEEVELLPDPAAPQQLAYFKFISANTFVPNDGSMTYEYYDAGCMYRTGGGTWTEHTVQLPQGAVIDYLRVYFYDNDAVNNAQAYLAAYDGYGHTTAIATAASTGTPGQSSALSDPFEYTVNNSTAALSVSLSYGNATTSSLRICGVRIRYWYYLSITDLPLILKGGAP